MNSDYVRSPLPCSRQLRSGARRLYSAPPGGWPGREAEWKAALGLLDSAAAGQGAVLLVEGAVGAGKTCLLTAAEAAAVRRGFAVARIRTNRSSELVETAAQVVERGAKVPVLITLDDLQWADRPTVAALRALPDELAAMPVGWLLVRRQRPSGPAIDRLLEEWNARGATRLRLGPLPGAAVAEVVARTLDGRPDDALLSLARGAGGNPGLLSALLDDLRQQGCVAIGDGRARLLADRPLRQVEETIESWLVQLSPAALNLLEVAAFLGGSFTPHGPAALLGCRPGDLAPAVDEAVASGLLTVVRDRTMVFQHDLVRQSITRRVPESVSVPLRRQAMVTTPPPAGPPPGSAPPTAAQAPQRPDDRWNQLSDSERTVAGLVARGLSNRQTADRMFLSPHTVSFHLRKVYRKFGITSRVELTRLTIEQERGSARPDPAIPPTAAGGPGRTG